MTKITVATLKSLFAKSHNRCAYPGCAAPLSEDSNTVTGQVCHIRSDKSRGPRFDKSYPVEKRNSAENLILMCGRHHKLIDSEESTYTTATLIEMKRKHEESGVVEISPWVRHAAEVLHASLGVTTLVKVSNKTGNVAINSPGALQVGVLNVLNGRAKLVQPLPQGSIGASQPMSAYCKYLIARYNEYQKGDRTGKSAYKYAALPQAVVRQFKNRWQDLPESDFTSVVDFLQQRIDRTIIGKNNKAKGHQNYHSFQEH
jgi:hypothetical protein